MQKNNLKNGKRTDYLIWFLFSTVFCMPFAIDYIANGNCNLYLFNIIPLIIVEILFCFIAFKGVQYYKIRQKNNSLTSLVIQVILFAVFYIFIVCFAKDKAFFNTTVTPIVAAFVGGFITLLGVRLTIEKQYEMREEEKRLSVKPYIYAFNKYTLNMASFQGHPSAFLYPNNKQEFFPDYFKKGSSNIYLKNTDAAIAIIDRVYTKNNVYTVRQGTNIIEKNTMFWISFDAETGDLPNDFHLVIKDIYGNEYNYKIENLGAYSTLKEEI